MAVEIRGDCRIPRPWKQAIGRHLTSGFLGSPSSYVKLPWSYGVYNHVVLPDVRGRRRYLCNTSPSNNMGSYSSYSAGLTVLPWKSRNLVLQPQQQRHRPRTTGCARSGTCGRRCLVFGFTLPGWQPAWGTGGGYVKR